MTREQTAAEALMARLRWGERHRDLTAEIETCPCSDEVKAGLFFLNGDWKRAHRVAQRLRSASGAHWHALVHRHEPDYANSKHWLRRVGASPIYPQLAAAAAAAGQAQRVAPGGEWDPIQFTDCFAEDSTMGWTRALDEMEITALLDHCIRLES